MRAGSSCAHGPSEQFAKLIVIDSDGTERVLIDPAELSAEQSDHPGRLVPARQGDRLAYTLSVGGDEEASLYGMDVATGDTVEGLSTRVRAGWVGWVPGTRPTTT